MHRKTVKEMIVTTYCFPEESVECESKLHEQASQKKKYIKRELDS